jgi:hypothetical protein
MPVTQVKSKQQLSITDNLSFGSAYRITNLLDPTSAQDAATKAYVDAMKQALDIKDSARVGTTGAESYTIASGAVTQITGTSIDGVSLAIGDRILIMHAPAATGAGAGAGTPATTQPANGIYEVTGNTTNLTVQRTVDANLSSEVSAGMFVFVTEGTSNADNGYVLTTNDPITLNTTGLTFTQFSGAGQVTAGAGLTKSGNTLNVGTASATRIVVNADDIDLATSGVTAATYGSTGFNVSQVTFDTYGRATSASNRDIFGSSLTANTVFAAPNGATGSPSFRLLVGADIPNLDASKITTGTLSVARGGTGVDGSTAANGSLLIGNGTGYTLATLTGTANQITVTNATGSITLSISTGYVGQTSITTLGTIGTGTWSASTIAANRGGTGQSTYTIGDILYADTASTLAKLAGVATGNALISGGVGTAPSWGKIGLTTHISGTLAIGNGGTGVTGTPTNGQLLIGNGSGYTIANLTAGTGISITNGAGTISLAVNSATFIAVANYVVRETPTGTINGTNATFTLAATPVAGTEQVYVNGIQQNSGAGNDYTISTNTITFLAGAIPQTGDVVKVTYLK